MHLCTEIHMAIRDTKQLLKKVKDAEKEGDRLLCPRLFIVMYKYDFER